MVTTKEKTVYCEKTAIVFKNLMVLTKINNVYRENEAINFKI